MSMSAEVFVLFREPVTEARALVVRECAGMNSLEEVWDADLHCWISDSGQLEYLDKARSGPLLGERSLEGRLWHGYLGGRYWSKSMPDYGGDPAHCRRVISALLDQQEIEGIWYGTSLLGGSSLLDPVALPDFTA